MTPPTRRVLRGFSIDEDGAGESPAPRRVRTRSQIMKGEGKRPPAKVELKLLAHNPFNPRDELTEIEETAESLRAKGQIQPVTVARREAFLAAHPGREEEIGDAEYVVIDGNRRLAAAHLAGLAELRIDVNDELAASAADLLESALIANIHRVDVPPLDQAKAIQELVHVHGSQGQVAKRLGKTPAWVSQRLALLELTPDLQEKVETGELKVEPARRIGRLPKEQQAAAAAEVINAVKAPRQRSGRQAPKEESTGAVNAVNTLGSGARSEVADRSTVNGVNAPVLGEDTATSGAAAVNAVNGEGASGSGRRELVIPAESPAEVVEALAAQLPPADLVAVAELLVDRVGGASRGAVASGADGETGGPC